MKPEQDPNSFAALFEASPKKGAPRKWRLGDVMDLEVVRIGKSEVFVALVPAGVTLELEPLGFAPRELRPSPLEQELVFEPRAAR